MPHCRRHTNEIRYRPCHLAPTTAVLSSCRTRRVMPHWVSRLISFARLAGDDLLVCSIAGLSAVTAPSAPYKSAMLISNVWLKLPSVATRRARDVQDLRCCAPMLLGRGG